MALAIVTLYLRLQALDSLPPWLWWGEATLGLEARGLLHGHLQLFGPRVLGQGPLYSYLVAPFVAAWDGQPFAVRLAGALLGTLEVPALYFLARALWRERPQAGRWAGLMAAGAWATSFWAQSINRIGLAVNAAPLLLTLAATAWLSWTHTPSRRRALFFGALAGLALLAYPPASVTLILWLALFLLLPSGERRALKRRLPWALLGLAVFLSPQIVHPSEILRSFTPTQGDAITSTNGPSAPEITATGAAVTEPWPGQQRDVLGAFLGYAGDPTPRYNIPGRIPFSLAMTGLFAGGLLAALTGLRRRKPRSILLLLWWLGICAAAVMGGQANPDFPRLLPALPAALLLAAWPVALAADWAGRHAPPLLPRLAAFVGILLVVEAVTTGIDYFNAWPRDADLYTWYQGDVWSAADRSLRSVPSGLDSDAQPLNATPAGPRSPGATAIIPIGDDLAAGLDYAFARTPLLHLQASPATVEGWLAANLGGRGGNTVRTVVWDEEPYISADATGSLPFYLAREGSAAGEETQRGYRILGYRLGPEPQFEAAGQQAEVNEAFAGGLTLAGARWGTAYPNADRSGKVAAGGTPFWAILSWRADIELQGKRVALDLVDAAGHRLASSESPLLDTAQEHETPWQPGTWQTYHLVEVPATQPAGPVSLEVRVYDAQSLQPLLPATGTPRLSAVLAQAGTAFAAAAGPLPGTIRPVAQQASFRVQILGVEPWPGTVAPGQVMTVRLYWQLAAPLAAPLPISVGLGETTAQAAGRLSAGTPVRLPQATQLDLRLPVDLGSGSYPLWLAVAGGAGSQVALGQVQVSGRPRVFTVPPLALQGNASFGGAIKLLGLETPPTPPVSAGTSVTVTLVWQALGTPPGNWVRFLHVLGQDGRPVAQVDGQACSGGCPTTSWLPGEVVIERVELALPADLPPGTYPLATGWYDPAALGMPRLPATDATGARLPDDLARLPAQLVVR